MPHTILNPAGLHDPAAQCYSHIAVTSGDLVFIAGQYASGSDARVTSADFAEQVEQAVHNLGTALKAVGLGFEHIVQLRTYIVDHNEERRQALGRVLRPLWTANPPTQTLVGVAALATPEILFEIDAVAAKP